MSHVHVRPDDEGGYEVYDARRRVIRGHFHRRVDARHFANALEALED